MAFTDRLHNRGSISTGYDIDNSLKFEDDNDEWLYRTNVSGTNAKTWTVSWWFKQTELRSVMGTATNHWIGGAYGEATRAGVDEYDRLWVDVGGGDGNPGSRFRSLSTARLRDTAAWYHVVIACDSTQSTEADRLKVWLNGVEVTAWDLHQIPTLNFASGLAGFAGIQMKWGSIDATNGGYSGYLAECNYLDGVTATQNDFGEFDEDSGIWKPKAYTGSYGTNGTYLDFTNASDLGNDESGNGNDYTLNNITSADQTTDTPTNNFATFNVLHPYSSASNHNPTFTEGATRFTTTLAGYWEAAVASMGITSGKWYFEAQPGTSTSHITDIGYGDESDIHDWAQDQADTNGFIGEGGTNSIGYLGSDTSSSYGNIWLGTGSTSNVNANYTISNIVGVAIDADNGYVYFARDNTYVNSGDPGSGASGTGGYTFQDTTTPRTGTVFPAVAGYYHTAATVININFGGYTTISISSAETDENGYGTFEYAPPTGYYALCTKNLAEYG